jgi:uncharacterized protein YjiK
MSKAWVVALVVTAAVSTACRESKKADAAELREIQRTREHELAQRLKKADANPKKDEPVAMWMLPADLREVSGLALTADGRLLTHDDNVGRIFVLDPRSGIVLNQFTLGHGVSGDFEAITVAGNDVYLLNSNSTLYRFREGGKDAKVAFTREDLHLGKECEFEGMAYEADSAWLLLPCKRASKKDLQDKLVIYRLRLQGSDSTRLTMMTIPIAQVIGSNDWKGFHPSDMTIDPNTGNYVLISSHEKGLVEITPGGLVDRAEPLPGKHSQPEGVAITKDNLLIVSDEGSKKPAAITLYRWRP